LPGKNIEQVKEELKKAKDTVTVEIEFISDAMFMLVSNLFTVYIYVENQQCVPRKVSCQSQHKDQTMFSLCWDIEELKNINTGFCEAYRELSSCINLCSHEFFLKHNVPEKLTVIRAKLTELLKRTSHCHRIPHFCVNDELWNPQG